MMRPYCYVMPGNARPFFRKTVYCLAAKILVAVLGNSAQAIELTQAKLDAEYWYGVSLHSEGSVLNRLTLLPVIKVGMGKGWRIESTTRLEAADDETGLGTVKTYAPISKPPVHDEHYRIEIDRLVALWRNRKTNLTLGKQTVAWGVLDGVQITDRFTPIRQRDFVAIDNRPVRLSRWGAQLRQRFDSLVVNVAVAIDPTVDQLPRKGDAFYPIAPRSLGGADLSDDVTVRVDDRSEYIDDATAGVRISKRIAGGKITALALSGPQLDPVLYFVGLNSSQNPIVELKYSRRSLFGATYEGSVGDSVLRAELAYIPDQEINVYGEAPLNQKSVSRVLAGMGIDRRLPYDIFFNFQMAVDRVNGGGSELVRPRTDVFTTIRAQRSFAYDTITAKAELIGSLSSGDGILRPALEWQMNNQTKLSIGVDWIFGDEDELFGQYEDQSRAWAKASISF